MFTGEMATRRGEKRCECSRNPDRNRAAPAATDAFAYA
jgi:hypothetical protein